MLLSELLHRQLEFNPSLNSKELHKMGLRIVLLKDGKLGFVRFVFTDSHSALRLAPQSVSGLPCGGTTLCSMWDLSSLTKD